MASPSRVSSSMPVRTLSSRELRDPANVIVDNDYGGSVQSGALAERLTNQAYGGRALAGVDPGLDVFRFTPNFPTAGTYRIYAWWPITLASSDSFQFEIHHHAGTSTITIDQQTNGGRWNALLQMVEDVPGFSPEAAYPCVRGSPAGARLFKVVEDNVRERGIEVRLETSARRLLTDGARRVTGVDTGEPLRAGAVILACGGFEADPEMQKQFWQAKPVLSAAFRGNTGDGIRMAQALGRGSGICGTTTALTASGTPTPPILSASERSVYPIGFQGTRSVTTCGCHGFFLIGTAAAS